MQPYKTTIYSANLGIPGRKVSFLRETVLRETVLRETVLRESTSAGEESASNRRTLPLPEYLDEAASVLVGVINRPKDLEIVYRQGWYRLPVRTAPRYLAAEYLALYQTRRCPPDGGGITLLAPILRYSLVTRGELLPDEAHHPRSCEMYYRLALGPIWHLPRPIPARRQQRIAFITTSVGCLLAAQDLADLWQHKARQAHLQQIHAARCGQQLPDDENWLYEGSLPDGRWSEAGLPCCPGQLPGSWGIVCPGTS